MPEDPPNDCFTPRTRKCTHRPEYYPGQGLSSSPTRASGPDDSEASTLSPYQPSIPEGDFDIQLDRAKNEAAFADLGAQLISPVIDRLSIQESQDARLEFSREPTVFRINTPRLQCTCIDDGSVVRRQRGAIVRI